MDELFRGVGDADALWRLDEINMQNAVKSCELPDIGETKIVRLSKRKSTPSQMVKEDDNFNEIKGSTLKAFKEAFERPTLHDDEILGEFEEAAVEVKRMCLHDLSMPARKKQKPARKKQMTAAEQKRRYLLLKAAAGKDPNAPIATRKPTRACANNDGTMTDFRPMVGPAGSLS